VENPFAAAPNEGAEAAEVVEVPEQGADDAVAEFDAPESVEESAIDESTEYGSFEPVKQPEKPQTVPLKRLSRVIGERNELRESLAAAERKLAEVNGKLGVLEQVQGVVNKKYAGNPQLLEFDANFMETFSTLTKTDPALAAAAAKIQAAMKQNGAPTVSLTPETTDATPETPESAEPDAAVVAIVHRDAMRTITEALSPHVKPHFAKMVAKDVIANTTLEDLGAFDARAAVEAAKLFFKEEGIPAEEYLLPKPNGGKKPAVGGAGKGRASTTPAAGGDAPEQGETPKFKTREELDAYRNKRWAELTRERFGA
jgi:hypothetical protein